MILLGSSTTLAQTEAKKYAKDQEVALPGDDMRILMNTCYVCHNPRVKSHDDIISPPLAAVKYIYKFKYPEKEEFVERMTDFVLNPDNRKAIMQGPVMRFGVMPEMPLDSIEVRLISEFIFDNEIEEPSWFPEYFEKRHGVAWKNQK